PADDPGRPWLLAVEPRLGRQRLHDPLWRAAAAGGADRRPGRAAAGVPSPGGGLSPPPPPPRPPPRAGGSACGSPPPRGIGGGFASAVILGMIVTMFPEPAKQAKAIGVYGFVASAGGSIGLLLGGVLTEAISWHWIFIINLPIGVGVAYMARKLVADHKG